MILRSRKITARPPKEPHTPRKSTVCEYPKTPQSGVRGLQRVQLKTPGSRILTRSVKKNTQRLINSSNDSCEEEDVVTPLKERCLRVHFQVDESCSDEPAFMDHAFSPIFCCLSPPVEDSDCCSPTTCKDCRDNSKEPYFSHIPEDQCEENSKEYKFNQSLSSASFQKRWKDIPLKTRSSPENTLIMDPERILVNSSLLPCPDPDYTFPVLFQDTYYEVYLKLRPHVTEFLETLCKLYEIFVFTTAKKAYAEQILEILDPNKKLFRHRLFQEQCTCVTGHYVKDLRIIQRDLAKTVVLDTDPHNFPFQISNKIPVKSWTGGKKDKELLTLLPILEKLTLEDDVRLAISNQFGTDDARDDPD
ncbi:uncharacterized protein RCH25_036152 [Pelodytes ibericus]